MDEIKQIVEEIGTTYDCAENNRWEVCRLIEAAYSEFPSYTRGLTESLKIRLKKSSDSIYSMRDAWRMREEISKFRGVSDIGDLGLSSSHFSSMYCLRERYNLLIETCFNWLVLAAQECLSVRALCAEVSIQNRESERKSILRAVGKIERLSKRIYQEAEYTQMPEKLRRLTRTFIGRQTYWMGAVREWLELADVSSSK